MSIKNLLKPCQNVHYISCRQIIKENFDFDHENSQLLLLHPLSPFIPFHRAEAGKSSSSMIYVGSKQGEGEDAWKINLMCFLLAFTLKTTNYIRLRKLFV